MTSLHDILPKLSKRGSDQSVSDYFLAWPGKEEGHPLINVEVDLAVDQTLHALFGQNAPIGEVCRHKQGTLDYFETDWLPQESAAAQAFVELAAIHLASSSRGETHAGGTGHAANGVDRGRDGMLANGSLDGGICVGYCRMNMSQSRHMARKSYTVERERCVVAVLGKEYVIEVSVCSTATMADRFRCIFQHRLTAVGIGRTRWAVSYVIHFVEKTNFMLRKTLETGAGQAIKSNFGVLEAALKEYARQQQ